RNFSRPMHLLATSARTAPTPRNVAWFTLSALIMTFHIGATSRKTLRNKHERKWPRWRKAVAPGRPWHFPPEPPHSSTFRHIWQETRASNARSDLALSCRRVLLTRRKAR